MPKLKTKKSAAKRFTVLKSGKVKRWKANKSHILTKKAKKRKRNLRKGVMMNDANLKNVKAMLPYPEK